MRRLIAALVLVATLTPILTACSDSGGLAVQPRSAGQRDVAPAFTLPDLRGGEDVSLAAYRGRPVLLNFWASWCGPCVEELPTLAKFARTHPELAVIGVASQDDPADSRRLVASAGVGYPVAVDSSFSTLGRYGGSGLPATVLVDPSGRIIATVYGPLNTSDMSGIASALKAG